MRLVVPYTDLRPETYRACRDWPDVEFVDVSGDDYAYGRLLQQLWADGRTFTVCEHDVVPSAGMLAELAMCRQPYCAFPVPLLTSVAPSLSLTRFAASLLERYPDVMDRVMRVPTNWGGPGHYRQLDVVLQRTVLLNRYGLQPHIHMPPATHLNEEKARLLPGAPLVTTVPAHPALDEPS